MGQENGISASGLFSLTLRDHGGGCGTPFQGDFLIPIVKRRELKVTVVTKGRSQFSEGLTDPTFPTCSSFSLWVHQSCLEDDPGETTQQPGAGEPNFALQLDKS